MNILSFIFKLLPNSFVEELNAVSLDELDDRGLIIWVEDVERGEVIWSEEIERLNNELLN